MVIGLTGGIASGKSSVSRWLQEQGCRVCDSDRIAREVVAADEPAWRQVVATFGEGILLPDRSIDRKKLGEIVFGDASAREKLNAIVHPAVVTTLQNEIYLYRETRLQHRESTIEAKTPLSPDENTPLILDIPLLFEAHLEYLADQI